MFEDAAKNTDMKLNSFYRNQRRVRKDVQNVKSQSSSHELIVNSTVINRYAMPYTSSGLVRICVDRNNAGPRLDHLRNKKGNKRDIVDIGGPFYKEQVSVSAPTHIKWNLEMRASTNSWIENTDAHVHPPGFVGYGDSVSRDVAPFSSYPGDVNDFELQGLGATAISRTIPTKPEMSLSTSLAELKDGIPNLIGKQLKRNPSLNAVGGEYLNFQFGVVPIVSDVAKVIELSKQYEKIIKQFRRDQGRYVRRNITLVNENGFVSTFQPAEYAYCGTADNNKKSAAWADKVRQDVHTSSKVWFSGAYKLAYPTHLDGALKDITEFNRVYGVIPTPELVWEMIPMSFLADWFSNVGDVITNVSQLGSHTQLAYGYIMTQSTYSLERSMMARPTNVTLRSNFPDTGKVVESKLLRHRKRRLRANPYGFSVSLGDLSLGQKAILTALSLSRLKM